MKKIVHRAILIFLITICLPQFVRASDLSVSPLIIDAEGQPRDTVPASFILENSSSRMQTLYTFVNNVSPQNGGTNFMAPGEADLSGSLANWITISRAVLNIKPGQQQKVEFSIDVPPVAVPGSYHARISLVDGTTRDEAAAHMEQAASVSVNFTVQARKNERLQLNSFKPVHSVVSNRTQRFETVIENIGDQPLAPQGEIVMYDSGGKEVGAVKVNSDGKTIEPGKTLVIYNSWTAPLQTGRLKAKLGLEYGVTSHLNLLDSTYFWLLPWQVVTALFLVGFAILFILLYIMYRGQQRRATAWQELAAYAERLEQENKALAAKQSPKPRTSRAKGVLRPRKKITRTKQNNEEMPI